LAYFIAPTVEPTNIPFGPLGALRTAIVPLPDCLLPFAALKHDRTWRWSHCCTPLCPSFRSPNCRHTWLAFAFKFKLMVITILIIALIIALIIVIRIKSLFIA
jgi:hypothetical protein